MSTSPKVKLIISIENGNAQATLEHLRNCSIEIDKLITSNRMADEIIFKPKSNSLTPENYRVYKEFFEQLKTSIRRLPVFLIEGNVDASIGLLAEQAEVFVIHDKNGLVSLFSKHEGTLIGEDLKDSPLFSNLERGKPLNGKDLQNNLKSSIMIEVMPPTDYMKLADQFGSFELHYVHDKASLARVGKVYEMNRKREDPKKEDSGIHLA